MCLNNEVISNFPKYRYGRFPGEQQVLLDVKESHGKRSRTLYVQKEEGWTQQWGRVGPSSSRNVHKYLSHFFHFHHFKVIDCYLT